MSKGVNRNGRGNVAARRRAVQQQQAQVQPQQAAERLAAAARSAMEKLEDRRLLSVAQTWVNDNWMFSFDTDGSGGLTTGDLVSDPGNGISPNVRTWGVNAFGTVTTGAYPTTFTTNPPTPGQPAATTINDAVLNTNVGGTVSVLSGSYDQTALINKTLSLMGLPDTSGQAPTITRSAGSNQALVTVQANNVTVSGIKFDVNQPNAVAGVVMAPTTVNPYTGLTVSNNQFTIHGGYTANAATGFIGFDTGSTAIAVNNQGSAAPSVTITGNQILPDDTGTIGSVFDRAIFLRAVGGSVTNNVVYGDAHDLVAQFVRGGLSVTGNDFLGFGARDTRGAQVDFTEPESTVTFSGNDVVPQAGLSPVNTGTNNRTHVRSVMVKNGGNPVNITGNQITVREVGVLTANSAGSTVSGNTFTPAAGDTSFTHVQVSNKVPTGGTINPRTITASVTGNTFNADPSGTGGTAVEFLNHNTTPAPVGGLAGALDVTGNTFNFGLDRFVSLDASTGASTASSRPFYGGTGAYGLTQMAPFSANVNATGNNFDLTNNAANDAAPAATLAQQFAVEDKVTHGTDTAGLGLVRVIANNVYVTQASGSIQRGVNVALSGDTVNVDAGNFVEQVVVDNKSVTIDGQGDSTVVTSPAGQLPAQFTTGLGRTYRPVVTVKNGTGGATVKDLKIDGNGNGAANSGGDAFAGAAAWNADATFDNVTVVGLRNTPLDGVQNGLAVYARNESSSTPHTVNITNSDVSDFQKNGVTVDGPGLTANITNNVITGAGPTPTIAQNGIQVSRGAGGTVSGNTVTGHAYTGGPSAASAGVLLFQNGNTTVSNNTLTGNDVAIYGSASGASTVTVSGNDFQDETPADDDNDYDLIIDGTGYVIGANNQFAGNVSFIENYSPNDYDLTSNGTTFDEVSNFAIEDKIVHQVDDATLGLVTWAANTVFVTPTSNPTATDNDYTRIANAMAAVGSSGWTIALGPNDDGDATFNWDETNAQASWALGNDGTAGTNDDYSANLPAGKNNLTITAADADNVAIQGPGDLGSTALEVGIQAYTTGSHTGITISNFEIRGIANPIGFYSTGSENFSGLTIDNMDIAVPADDESDGVHNIGVHYAFGQNISITGNRFTFANTSTTPDAASYGIQSNTHTTTDYDGLNISGNTFTVANGGGTEEIVGLWENGHAHGSDITVSGNTFTNNAAGNTNTTAFLLTSHSTASSTVSYSNNTVTGANIGFEWLATYASTPQDYSAHNAIVLSGNNVSATGTAVQVGGIGAKADLQGNLFNSGATDNQVDVRVQANAGAVTFGTANQFGGDQLFVDNQSSQALSLVGNTAANFEGLNPAAPATADDNYRIEDKIFHKVDSATSGRVTWNSGGIYVTDPAAPGSTDSSIQRGIDAANPNETVNVEDGVYDQSVNVNKAVVIDGQSGGGAVTVRPAPAQNGGAIFEVAPAGGGDVTIRDLAIADPALAPVADYGVRVQPTVSMGTLTVEDSSFTGLRTNGIYVQGAGNEAGGTGLSAQDVVVDGVTFTDNGTLNGGGSGGINLFFYNGDATFRDVVITNAIAGTNGARGGIQMRGVGGGTTAPSTSAGLLPMGDVTFEDVNVSGTYRTYMITLQRYSTADVSFDDVVLGGPTSSLHGTFGAALRFDAVGSGSIASPATVNLGDTKFAGLTGPNAYQQVFDIEFAPDNNHAFLVADATGTVWNVGGIDRTAASLTVAEAMDVEDRIEHYVDPLHPTHGTFKGFARLQAGTVFVGERAAVVGMPLVGDGSIRRGVEVASAGDTVHVDSGTFVQDVVVDKSVSLRGAGPGVTTVSGAIGGDSNATFHIQASNVEIAGFTITREGNNPTDWNNVALNLTGIAIQGQSLTGANIHDNQISGNRTGIDVNNSNGHTVRNNVIADNRTGLIFRNQTDNMTVVENDIAANWTVGVLFLDASGGTNVPVQSALNSNFNNNNISGNWYGQIVDRQVGGAIPAPGTTNLKNFSGNWYGTATPAISAVNSTEPGYAAQIPVAYGGSATAPGGQPDILGLAVANFDVNPWLNSGTDTNVETVPGRGTYGFQGSTASVTATAALAQTGAPARIGEAIALLPAAGGTVHVTGGTYTENVSTLGKDVTLHAGSSPAQVTINGNLSIDAGDTLPIELTGTNPATQYDNFVVNGDVSLNGATLSLSRTFTPAGGTVFTIITNNGSNPVGGTFAGLPEGAVVTLGGVPFTISYVGGNGNDVTLTTDAVNAVYVNDTWVEDTNVAGGTVGVIEPGDIVDSNPGAGDNPSVTDKVFGYNAFALPQDGINAVTSGGTVHVLTGEYKQNLAVNKSVSILGPNAGTAGSGTRANGEAVLRASGNTAAVVTVTASNVTLDGLKISGDDTAVTGQPVHSGADANALYAVTNGNTSGGAAINNLDLRNTIVERTAIGFFGNLATGVVSTGSDVQDNLFQDIGVFDFGYAVTLRNNFYANVTGNVMNRVHTGIHVNNFNLANSGAWNVTGNAIDSYAGGMWFNQTYSAATPMTLTGNTFNAESEGPGAVANNVGLLVTGGPGFVGAGTVTGNTITGHHNGVVVWGTSSFTLGSGNSVSGAAGTGITVTNDAVTNPIGTTVLGPVSNPPTNVTLNGVSVSNSTTGVTVRGPAGAAPVSLTLSGTSTIAGGTDGLRVDGPNATLGGNTLGSTAFSGQSGAYVRLANGAYDNQRVNGQSASYDGVVGNSATVAQGFDIEDKVVHAVDDASLGFVDVKDNNVFVTTPVVGSTDSSIQRGIDAAEAGDTVNIENGIYDEAVVVNKALTLDGETAGGVTMRPTANNQTLVDVVLPGPYAAADDVTVKDINFSGTNGAIVADYGVRVPPASVMDTLTVQNSDFAGFRINGIYVQGSGNEAGGTGLSARNVVVQNSDFDANGAAALGGAGAINLFFYNGDASFTDLDITNELANPLALPNSYRGGIQLRGVGGGTAQPSTGAGVLPMGTVVFNDVDITGDYRNYMITLQRYTTASVSFINSALGGPTSSLFGGFGAALRFDAVGSGTLASPATVDLGQTNFRGLNGANAYVSVFDLEFAPDNTHAFLKADGDQTQWNGLGMVDSDAEAFAVEDRVLHYVDQVHPTHGTYKGFLELVPGNVYVSDTNGSIQHGVNVAPVGGTVKLDTGTYDGAGNRDVDVNKRVTIDGMGAGSTIVDATGGTNGFSITASGTAANPLTLSDLAVTNATGAGVLFAAPVDEVDLNAVQVQNSNFGVHVTSSTPVTNLTLNNASLTNNVVGFRMSQAGRLSGLDILGGSITNNQFGFYNEIVPGTTGNETALTDVLVSGTTFSGNTQRAIYVEKLNDADFNNVTLSANTASTVADINLKGGNYSDVNFTGGAYSNTGTGSVLYVKARNDAPSYNGNPATLTGLTVDGVTLTSSAASPSSFGSGLVLENNVQNPTLAGVNFAGTGNGVLLSLLPSQTIDLGNSNFTSAHYVINATSNAVNGTAASYDGVVGNGATDAQAFDIVDRIVDGVDAAGLGLVRVRTGDVFVTPNSFVPVAPFNTTAPSINRGINAASVNDEVFVEAGNYTAETVNVNKTVALRGAQHGVDARNRSAVPESVISFANGGVAITANDVVLDGFTVSGTTGGQGAGVYIAGTTSGHQVLNNILRDNVFGLYLNSSGANQTLAQHNWFDDNNRPGAASGNGIYADAGSHDVVVDENLFTDQNSASMVFAGTQSDLEITDNDINGGNSIVLFGTNGALVARNLINAPGGSGVFVSGSTNVEVAQNEVTGMSSGVSLSSAGGASTNVSIHNNKFHTNGLGVSVGTASYTGQLDVYDNSIAGNTVAGLRNNAAGATVDAESNWWGAANGPAPTGSGDAVTGTNAAAVDYTPWLTDGTDTQPGVRGFQPNAVDATPPATPDAPDLVSDTGTNTADDITSERFPTFQGFAEQNSTVRVYANGNQIGIGTADGTTGAYTITSTVSLADGTHAITATATDGAGNTSFESAALNITVDDTDPSVDIVFSPDPANEGQLVSVDATITDNLSGVESIAYTVSDGTNTVASGNTEDFSFTPADQGTYTVTYTVTDVAGNQTVYAEQLTVNNVAPTVTGLAATPNTITEGQTVSLVGTVNDPGTDSVDLTIDWGDGSTDTVITGVAPNTSLADLNITHQYVDDNPSGTTFDQYTITVTATDNETAPHTSTATTTVTVNNAAPALVLNTLAAISEGNLATLSGTYSDNGAFDSHTITIDWGDGSSLQVLPVSGNAFSVQHTYADDNATDSYTITVTLSDDDNNSDTETASVTVTNTAPSLTLDPVSAVVENGFATLTGTYTDPGSPDTHSLLIDWGDGSTPETVAVSGNSFSVQHQYLDDDADDSYTISVTISDDDGGSDSETTTVAVTNANPSLSLNTVAAITEGGLATLTGTYGDVGSLDTHSLTIDWGDGTAPETVAVTGGVINVQHQYVDDNPSSTTSDTYNISTTLTDDDGGTAAASQTVVVNNAAPTLTLNNVAAVLEGGMATLTGTYADAGTADTHTLTIDWGDGTPAQTVTVTGNAFSVQHLYVDDNPSGTSSDTYTINATLTDDDTGSASASKTVVVNNVAPALVLNSVAAVVEGNDATLSGTFTDPGTQDLFTITVDWGDGSTPEQFSVGGGSFSGILHTYADDNATDSYTITVTLSDDDGGSDTKTTNVTVTNANPTAALVRTDSLDELEGNTFTFAGSATDPAGANDTLTYSYSVTKNGNPYGTPASGVDLLSYAFTADDNGTYVVSLVVTDEDGGVSNTATQTVVVDNVDPALTLNAVSAVVENGVATLSGSYTDPGTADTHTLLIDWGDGSTPETVTVTGNAFSGITHQYLDDDADDIYTISVTISDDDGGSDTETTNVTVTNANPSLTLNPVSALFENGFATLTGTYADIGSQDTHSLLINWGDGTPAQTVIVTGNAFSVQHQYVDDNPTGTPSDTYNISVTLSDDDGGTDAQSTTVVVNNVAPVLVLNTVTAVVEGNDATLSGTFTDQGGQDIHTITVDWGDGSPTQNFSVSGGSFGGILHTYADDNATDTYTITVTLSDDDLGSDTKTTTVTVTNAAPVLTLDPVSAIFENGMATLTGSYADVAADTHSTLINWGDGTPAQTVAVSGGNFSVQHQYVDDNPTGTSSDSYNISVTITDDDGGSDTESTTVTVNNVAPVLVLNPVTAISENGTATLSGTYSDVGTADTHELSIDWADGSPVQTITVSGGTFSVTHQYLDDNAADNYVASATLTDDDGGTHTQTANIAVTNVAPALTLNAVSAVSEGGTATLTGTYTDVGTLDTHSIAINWGDGSPVQNVAVTGGSFSVTHSYVDDNPSGTPSDSYTIGVTLSDDDGGTDTESTSVTVNNVAPSISISGPTTGTEGTGVTFNATTIVDPGTADTFSYTWTVTGPHGFTQSSSGTGQPPAFSFTPPDDGSYSVTLAVSDDDTGTFMTPAATLTVGDVDPVIVVDSLDSTVLENGVATLVFHLVDPGNGDLAATNQVSINWGDGTAPTVINSSTNLAALNTLRGGGSVTLTHTYADDATIGTPSDTYTLTFATNQAADAPEPARAYNPATVQGGPVSVTVNNVDPTGDFLLASPSSISAGDSVSVNWTSQSDSPADLAEGLRYNYGIDADNDGFLDPGERITPFSTFGDGTYNGGTTSDSVTIPGSNFSTPGVYTVISEIRDNDGGVTTESITVNVGPVSFRVASITPNASGFDITFNRAFDAADINLYANDVVTPADVTVMLGATKIRGSLVFTGPNTATFVRTYGPSNDVGALANGTYTITIRSNATDGFNDGIEALDGNNDGTAGDDAVRTVVVNNTGRVVSLPDFTRGPNQSVEVPSASTTTTGPQNPPSLPVRINAGTNIRSLDFTLTYDETMLTIDASNPVVASSLPAGWGYDFNFVDLPGNLKQVTITASGESELTTSGTLTTVLKLNASVPSTAVRGPSQILRLSDVVVGIPSGVTVNEVPAQGDNAVHQVGYFGDTNNTVSGTIYTGADVTLMQRVVANLATGFQAYRNTDPLIIGDINGSGTFSGADTSLVQARVANQVVAQIPPITAPSMDTVTTTSTTSGDAATQTATSDLRSAEEPTTTVIQTLFSDTPIDRR